MKTPIQVFLNCDARYLRPLTVELYSLFKVSDPERPLRVFVAHDASFAAEGCREAIRRLSDKYPFVEVTFIDITHLLDRHREVLASKKNRWSPVIWAGPLVTDVLPDSVTGRLIYLDVDMLICHPLDELFDIDLKGNLAAAVVENERADSSYLESCEWPADVPVYFNNGTMLIDLDAYRRDRICDRIVAWYARYKEQASCTDQDSQNAVFGDRTLPLHPKWNFNDGLSTRILQILFNPFRKTLRGNSVKTVLEAVEDPFIIHYVNHHKKPWNFSHRPERLVYHQNMKELGLFDEALNGRNLREKLTLAFYDTYNGIQRRCARALLKLLRGGTSAAK